MLAFIPRVIHKILFERVGLQFAMFLKFLGLGPQTPTRGSAPGSCWGTSIFRLLLKLDPHVQKPSAAPDFASLSGVAKSQKHVSLVLHVYAINVLVSKTIINSLETNH